MPPDRFRIQPAEVRVSEPSPAAPPEPVELLATCLQRLEAEGAAGVAALLRAHPLQAPRLLRQLLVLAELGLLPEGPGER